MCRTAAFGGLFAVLMLAAASCIDLFHSTSDFKNFCDIHPSAPDCRDATFDAPSDAGGNDASDAASDFCDPSFDPRAHAEKACAWLGACEGPIGNNQLGSCMFHALLAYSCTINPNQRPLGNANRFWTCMANVTSCDGVQACVFPATQVDCVQSNVDYTACAPAQGFEANRDTRVECIRDAGPDARARGENCAAWGQTCAATMDGGAGGCFGDPNGSSCDASACSGTELQICSGEGNIGIDCANSGAGRCNPTALACEPNEPPATPSCTPSPNVTCTDAGVAEACFTGSPQTVRCDLLTGQNSCHASFDNRWDLARACFGTDACTDDCSGTRMTSCYAGTRFVIDCSEYHLQGCSLTPDIADPDGGMRAACSP